MSSNPKKGALDRQVGLPRVTLRFAIAYNPADFRFHQFYTKDEEIVSRNEAPDCD